MKLQWKDKKVSSKFSLCSSALASKLFKFIRIVNYLCNRRKLRIFLLRLKFERNNSHESEKRILLRRIDTDNINWDNFGELDICRSQKNNAWYILGYKNTSMLPRETFTHCIYLTSRWQSLEHRECLKNQSSILRVSKFVSNRYHKAQFHIAPPVFRLSLLFAFRWSKEPMKKYVLRTRTPIQERDTLDFLWKEASGKTGRKTCVSGI